MTIFYEKIYGWSILTLFLLNGVEPSCNVNNCDLEYCNGDGCIKCEDSYYLSGTSCYKCRSNCVTCTGYSTCTECVRGKYGTTCEGTCSSTCPACTSSSLCTECIPGRHGATCNIYCPESCTDILCYKNTGKCSIGCRHGYYNSGDDCNKCPDHCTRCTDSTHCSDCENGFYGSYCQIPCPSSCKSQACDKILGHCTQGCIDRYYQNGNECHECPYKCMTCEDENTCGECKTGYWGPQCQNDCPITCNKCTQTGQCLQVTNCDVSNCVQDYCYENSCLKCKERYYLSGFYCYQCPSHCTKCTSSSSCTECDYGRYGTKCEYTCRTACPDCVSSTNCTVCIPGRYGSYCQYPSPLSCIDMLSDKTSGKCVLGCRHGYYRVGEDCNKCPENCKRCSDNSHCTVCEQGYFGSYCQWACPSSCIDKACDKEFGLCTGGCLEGYFLEGTNCSSCPHRCVRCGDRNSCTLCKTGYWGQTCEKDCPEVCDRCGPEGQCVSGPECDVNNCLSQYCWDSSCIECKDGYYLSGSYCYSCPSHCTKCSSSSTCSECETRKYGQKCEYTCRDQCRDCVSSSNCTECIPGRHGSYCLLYCPLGCIDILCVKETGKCSLGCRHGYYTNGDDCPKCPEHCKRCSDATHCTECETGWYGSFCQNPCPSSCKNQECDKELGTCLEGCIAEYYPVADTCTRCPEKCMTCSDVNTCTECKTGYWGQQCQTHCPSDCYKCTMDGLCVASPACGVSNCLSEYCWGSTCINCKDGYYLSGSYCYSCPSHCTKCSSYSSCSECEYRRYGQKCEYTCRDQCRDCVSSSNCTECIPGRHGSYCQTYCPLGCIDILCVKETGKCSLGCKHGYYKNGDDCPQCPEHCKRCYDATNCTECKTGWYGSYCQHACPSSCKDQECDKELGTCLEGCIAEYYPVADTCTRCPDKCMTCSDVNTCTECKTGYWGQQCQTHCPSDCYKCTKDGTCFSNYNCAVSNCDREYCSGSSCIKCKDGYYLYGDYCSRCPSGCTKCSSYSACQECVLGKYGSECKFSCNDRCVGCVSSTQCAQCIPGRHGSSCQLLCSLGCIDILCDKDSGRCTRGCRHGYYLSVSDCTVCPQHCTKCSSGNQCLGCEAGYYGTFCQNMCHQSCLDQVCDKDSGECTEGCVKGYYQDGSSCVTCPSSCVSCTSERNCTECHTGLWGLECQFDCPGDCLECNMAGECKQGGTECYINNCKREYCSVNSCIQCEDGYYLFGTNCHQCYQYCTKCSGSSTCSQCVRGRYGNQCDYSCNSVCLDCISSSNCTTCIAGRYGSACQSYCPLGCNKILCDKTTGKCTEGCRLGYYSTGADCNKCPETCARCSNGSICSLCKTGFYGTDCQRACPPGCKDNMCHKDTGRCTAAECIRGFYYSQDNCIRCPEQCASCVGGHNCTECKNGYWGTECQTHCPETCSRCTILGQCIDDPVNVCYVSHCDKRYCSGDGCIKCEDGYYLSDTNCYKCPANCLKCTDSNTCSKCVKGRHGSTCSLACKSTCIDCTSSSQCGECIPGRYGSACEQTCPLACKDILCDKSSGKCMAGCNDGYFSSGDECYGCPNHCAMCSNNSYCISCVPGYHSVLCQKTCPVGCKNQLCDFETGNCTDGCAVGYHLNSGYCVKDPVNECYVSHCDKRYCAGDGCIKCEDGYYLLGTNCYKCQNNCLKCTDIFTCTDCVRGRHGSTCSRACRSTCIDCRNSSLCGECIPGRYGSACELTCPLACKDILCDKNSGKCTVGCNDGYYSSGEECYGCPNHCASCSNGSFCISCVPGYHGALCHQTCPVGCKNQLCDFETGNCTDGCVAGYHFNLGYCVEDLDPSECAVAQCVHGYCFGSTCTKCNVGYYVDDFKCKNCPDNCIKCSSSSHCEECISGRQGSVCQFQCSLGCRDSVCSSNGFCTEGCAEGYTMTRGECQSCPRHCKSCSSMTSCSKCLVGYWGSLCQYDCLGCHGNGCGRINDCTHGCIDGYYEHIIGEGRFECAKCSPNCQKCTNSESCSACNAGYWGSKCNIQCNANCKGKICNLGYCSEGCRSGYYGNFCSQNCLPGCETCDSGVSCTACVVGKHGYVCEKDCSANCFKSACFRNNGSCLYGCSPGFSGDTCSKEEATSTCETNKQVGSDNGDNGAAIGLGVVLAIAVFVICVLVFFLLRRRQSNKQADEDYSSAATVMNQTYDTSIGNTNIKDLDRRRSEGEDNLATYLDAADQGHVDSSHGNHSHGNRSHSNPTYDASGSQSVDDGEYSVILT